MTYNIQNIVVGMLKYPSYFIIFFISITITFFFKEPSHKGKHYRHNSTITI